MKKTGLIALLLCFLFACGDGNAPDVSNIDVKLTTHRFDQDVFALDTNALLPSMQKLVQAYPTFATGYFQDILGLPPFNDTTVAQAESLLKQFIRISTPLHEEAYKVFSNTKDIESTIRKGLQYTRYYFPNYKVPTHVLFYIGPLDVFMSTSLSVHGDVITPDGSTLAVAAQLHLGKDFSAYTNELGRNLFPAYISRRFTPEYVPVNCLQNVIEYMYPEKPGDRTLVEQMVEKGKRLYVLDKLLPGTPDTLKIGYTNFQLKGCYSNEGKIWNFFLVNNLLMNDDPMMVKNYLNEGPNTPELGDGSPGYIGLFTGWQIVKKYMDKHSDMKLPDLLQTPAMKIYQESKYKPK